MTRRRARLRPPLTVAEALDAAATALAAASPSARLDADVLLRHATGLARAELLAHPQRRLDEATCARFAALVERRRGGEPVAYITGRREFWSLDLEVSPATLIPRAETELLVERALERIPPDADWRAADLGTGCGAIALALATERPRLRVVATDASEAVLALARANAQRLGIDRVEFRAGDWFAPLQAQRFHCIVSNPPYLRADDPHLERGDLRFEPRSALVTSAGGLEALRRLCGGARAHLHAGGWLILEHGYDQAQAVRQLCAAGGLAHVRSYRDLAGHERVTEGCMQ